MKIRQIAPQNLVHSILILATHFQLKPKQEVEDIREKKAPWLWHVSLGASLLYTFPMLTSWQSWKQTPRMKLDILIWM